MKVFILGFVIYCFTMLSLIEPGVECAIESGIRKGLRKSFKLKKTTFIENTIWTYKCFKRNW